MFVGNARRPSAHRSCLRALALALVALLAGLALAQGSLPAQDVADTVLAQGSADLWRTPSGRERVFQAVVDLFRDNYWNLGYTDWDAWAARFHDRVVGADSRDAFDGAFRSMVASLGDDHSNWLGAANGGGGGFFPQAGVGVITSYVPGVGLVVERVLPTTPADKAGLRRGDVIESVVDGGGSSADLRERADDPGAILASASSTGDVSLTVRRDRSRFSVSLKPLLLPFGELELQPSAQMLDATTGYLYLPSFTREDTAEQFNTLLGGLIHDGATSLVLDLRGNRGGSLNQLGLVLGAFVDGTWAQAVSRGQVAWRASYAVDHGVAVSRLNRPDGRSAGIARLEDPVRFPGRLVVLVDHANSSAGEIGPLVLAHLGRAEVVGEQTSGNVEAVRGFDLPDGSAVMVAVADMQAADGASFEGGVTPAIQATATAAELARGYDRPVAAARALLHDLPFEPGRLF